MFFFLNKYSEASVKSYFGQVNTLVPVDLQLVER